MPHNLLPLITAPLRSAFAHRHLLREFVTKEVKGRFAGSMGGLVWTLINPIATICIYFFVFSYVLRIQVTVAETGTDKFAIFFLAGLFPWLLFADGLSRSAGCLIDNANLITKVVFPVELLPAGTVFAAFIVNGVGTVIFVIYLVYQGFFHLSWLVLPFVLASQLLFTWGLASFLAAASVFIRDIGELLGIIIMAWFFATPIIYPASMVPEQFALLLRLNPMGVFIEIYRGVLLSHQLDFKQVIAAGIIGLISYALGSFFFMRARPAFGDVL